MTFEDKKHKRKSSDGDIEKKKKKKRKEREEEKEIIDEEGDDESANPEEDADDKVDTEGATDQLDETLKQIKESKKVKKKKGKKQKEEEPHVHESKGQNKALRYLETFSLNREDWKFEKCRQIWLVQNCYNDSRISDKHFDMLLQYLATMKGKMRDVVQETASGKIDHNEKWDKLTAEGKSAAEALAELKQEKHSEKVVDRAKKIVELLSE